MRREVAVGLALLVLLTASLSAAGLPGPSTGSFVPRGPIAIVRDSEFTAANGVVAGSGTPSDPYVIAGWRIVSGGSYIGIQIRNTTAAFVIHDNLIDAATGVHLSAMTSAAVVRNNQFVVRSTGIVVADVNATVLENTFIGEPGDHDSLGVKLENANARVDANAFQHLAFAVRASGGSPTIVGNDVHNVLRIGIEGTTVAYANVSANIFTSCRLALRLENTIGVRVGGNDVSNCDLGMDIWWSKDVDVRENRVRYAMGIGVSFETSSGNFTSNTVIDGHADAVIIWHSPLMMTDNRIENNLGIGLHFSMSSADVRANVISRNGVGISLAGEDVPTLHANVLTNNTVGLDIPYGARQAIAHMSANLVNGVNVDGTLDAAAKVFFYKEANVVISGGVRDSGFSAGYYGSISAQGNVVLYEVDTALVEGTILGHATVGVGVVNSFNVQVVNATIVQAQVGVKAEALSARGASVPPCVVSVKDSNITIPVDPPATVGVDVRGCFGIVLRNHVSVVDYGIRFDAGASGIIANNSVTGTRIGLDVAGKPGEVAVSGNALVANRIGARLSGTVGTMSDNLVTANTDAGVRLERGAALAFERNRVVANARGIVDAMPCAGPATCSSLTTSANLVAENGGDGLAVHGASTLRGDVLTANGGAGARLGSATLRHVTATGNGGDGLVVAGVFALADSDFVANGANGAVLRGTGTLVRSNFTYNTHAGLVIASIAASAYRINASYNRDGIEMSTAVGLGPETLPTVSVPGLVAGLGRAEVTGVGPLDVHRSVLVGNERDAIRAGASYVNATHNYFGPYGPRVNVADQVGAFQNGVSPLVRFVPYYTDPWMTQTGPVAGI